VRNFIRLLFIALVFISFSCAKPINGVTIFHAGSLSVPLKKVKSVFEKENPTIKILLEASGSRSAARKISDLHKKADIMASADYRVIDNLLIPDYANFNIRFATNEMVIVYTEKSKYANKISSKNWYKILLKKDVAYGHSDPEKDPCGYRTRLVWQLAEKFYKIKNLNKKLIDSCPEKNVRPKETDLIALLENGNLDYFFLYKSVAKQHNLKYVVLPEKINLVNPKYNSFYREVSLKLRGKKPGSHVTVKGEAMVYGITLVKNAPHKKEAIKFLKFLLSKKGLAILKSLGQNPIDPPKTKNIKKLPNEIKSLVKKI